MALKDLFGKNKSADAKANADKKAEGKEVKAKKAKTTTSKAKPASAKAKAVKTEKVAEEKTPVVPAVAKAIAGEESKGKSDYGYRITEKATCLADKNVYVLNVPKTINKISLKKDLETKYKVTVLNINIVNSPKKDKFYRGKWGTKGGGKKAYITLKAGDSIVL